MLDIRNVLLSSGWEKSAINGREDEYIINFPEVRFYFNEVESEFVVSKKERFSQSKVWRPMKVVVTGKEIEVGDYLASSGLLNEGEYAEFKRRRERMLRRREFVSSRRRKQERIRKVLEFAKAPLRQVERGARGALGVSIVVGSSYFSYHYLKNNVSPEALYSYIKNNYDSYSLEEMIVNETIQGLTYSQVVNLDYAIENDQVEELLDKVENKPQNINYINCLRENIPPELN